jgi:hypothetical protein
MADPRRRRSRKKRPACGRAALRRCVRRCCAACCAAADAWPERARHRRRRRRVLPVQLQLLMQLPWPGARGCGTVTWACSLATYTSPDAFRALLSPLAVAPVLPLLTPGQLPPDQVPAIAGSGPSTPLTGIGVLGLHPLVEDSPASPPPAYGGFSSTF